MRDIYAAVTERFVEQLKAGTVPWQRPWVSSQNLVSKKAYRGINSLLLGSSRFGSPFWMTFKQALELGGTVKKGERASPVIFYKFVEKTKGGEIVYEGGKPVTIPFIRWANVFNLDQTEGIKAPSLAIRDTSQTSIARAAAIVEKAALCPIHHQGFAAAYSPHFDAIYMPRPGFFRSQEDYHHTLFHEMTHATGSAGRLKREGVINPIKFGSDRYSKEELIAELGAAFLSNDAGMLDKVRFDNAAAYLESWTRKLTDDPSLIVSAASQAQRGADFIRGIDHVIEESLHPQAAPKPTFSPSFNSNMALEGRAVGRSRSR